MLGNDALDHIDNRSEAFLTAFNQPQLDEIYYSWKWLKEQAPHEYEFVKQQKERLYREWHRMVQEEPSTDPSTSQSLERSIQRWENRSPENPSYPRSIPESHALIIRALCELPGIGKVNAQRLVTKFGFTVFQHLDKRSTEFCTALSPKANIDAVFNKWQELKKNDPFRIIQLRIMADRAADKEEFDKANANRS